MDIELAKCECCGLKEDCTQDYITEVKANFDGKWLCGLCSEAVRDEVNRGRSRLSGSSGGRQGKQKMMMMMNNNSNNNNNNMGCMDMEEAVKAHMAFCRKYDKSNPAIRVADGMRQMLRRRSGDLAIPNINSDHESQSSSLSKKYSRSASTSQVGDIDRSAFSSYY